MLVTGSLGGGGAERVLAWLAGRLDASGERVILVTFSDARSDVYPVPTSVTRVGFNLLEDTTGVVSAVTGNAQRIRRLRGAIREYEPRCVLAFLTTANVTCLLACAGTDVPVFVAERNYPPQESLPRVWRWLRVRTYRYAAGVVAQTRRTGDWLEKHAGAVDVSVIANPTVHPVPITQPVVPPRGVIAPDRSVILAAGRLVHAKGFDRLLEAFAAVATSLEGWDLVVLGEGDCRSQLESEVARLGLEARVHFPGRAGNVAEWYAHADLFVMSSRHEGYPNVLVEAMASGLPAIAMNCETGPAELIRNNVNGMLTPTDDVGALSEALLTLAHDPDRRTALGAAACEVRDSGSPDRVFARWQALLDVSGRAK